MTTVQTSSVDFLKAAYEQLEFRTGDGYYHLTDITSSPDLAQVSWIEQARKLGAETIFFVGDYPTVLFFKLDDDLSVDMEAVEDKIRRLHLQVWNMSRAPLFFVALPGELRVYSAYQKPVRELSDWLSEQRWLERVKTITQIAELRPFSRPEIESGHLFQQQGKYFDRENRVDQWLLRNLRLLRQKLEGENKAKREYVHALIGRSIFIRYLEDREVLIKDYFTDAAISKAGEYRRYVDVLTSKRDTYDLFRKVVDDFNGNLFPLSAEEEQVIDEENDLHLLSDFLRGRSMADQPNLLFWAYQFDIIPIELISAIYEEFYHEHDDGEDRGTHYTPTSLVNFLLSECLTPERLEAGARVLDPACGSGIFLVEAFKRIVYHECRRQDPVIDFFELSRETLTTLLTDRLVGIDVNKAAIQVAAFSLYLAFLDFRKPRDIRQHKELPKLIYDPAQPDSGKSLFHADAFQLTAAEQAELQTRIAEKKRYKGKAADERMANQALLPLKDLQFDIIVGNPPWGAAASNNQSAVDWCQAFRYPVGDRELSQCFIWRTQRLLKPGGEIGLLVSTGVFFKHQQVSLDFRQQWLKRNRIRAIYNFAHVRKVFFRKQKGGGISPFAAIFFAPAKTEEALQNRIFYVSIKRSAFIERLQAVTFDKTDMHTARQSDFLAKDWLWKTYMWGGVRDVELISELKVFYQSLGDFVSDYGRGYEEGGAPKDKSTRELGVEFELRTNSFYENVGFSELIVPLKHRKIRRLSNINVYQGPRLLIKRGVSRSGEKMGEIQARLANESFAFKNSIHGFRLDSSNEQERKILLAIVLSSLSKYYHFLTCSTWGFWHHEIHLDEHLSLPIHFPDNQELENRILTAVEPIMTGNHSPTLFDSERKAWRELQDELDEAIFELYDLSEAQKDLVRDLCQVTLEFFYKGPNSQAVRPPPIDWLKQYRDSFLEIWEERLATRGKTLEARIYAPHHGLLCGLSFELKDLGDVEDSPPITDSAAWQRWFRRLSRSLRREYSSNIYIDNLIKALPPSSMCIIKRAERRLWTKSQARQDAHELLTEVFKLEWQHDKSAVQ